MKRRTLLIGVLLLLVSACTPFTAEYSPTLSSTATPVPTPTFTLAPTSSPKLTETAPPAPTTTPEPRFSFVVTSDMSHYSAQKYIQYPNFFAALLRNVAQFGPGDFMVSTGDVIPAADTRWTIEQVLGEGYPWFPLPGNHDFGKEDITFLQGYDPFSAGEGGPSIVNWGPEPCTRTTYSFDYQNAHFIALNVYCDEEAPWGIDGKITDTLYDWLVDDLEATTKEHIFVFGHEPAYPQPDQQTGDIRHLHDSLDQYPPSRDRFWRLLQEQDVLAYVHGHTHNYSAVNIHGVWQLDAGQSMGVRAAPSRGTFLIIEIEGEQVRLKTCRGEDGPGFSYSLREEITLSP